MEYQVTATRRRPKNLEQLSGQTFVQQTLYNALSSGHIAHAYLFSGPRGVGKTSTARILARALNCEQGPTSKPCGQCYNCQDILSGKAMDVMEIDGASHTSVDDIREIKDEVLYAPSSARYKIFIIDEVHMLSNSAFNALLKTIEEPPQYIVFIFATTEIHKVPLTVRSRCQHYNFHLVSLEVIQKNLMDACCEIGIEYREEALIWVAREAKGSMRDAYTLFDQIVAFCSGEFLSLELIQQKMGLVAVDQLGHLCNALIDLNLKKAIGLYQKIIHSGTSLEQMLVDLCEYLRALLLLQSSLDKQQLLLLLPYPTSHYSTKALQSWNVEQLCHALERCFALYRNLRYSINEHFEFELLLFELSRLHYYSSSAQQLHRLEQLTEQLQKGLPNCESLDNHSGSEVHLAVEKKNSECLNSAESSSHSANGHSSPALGTGVQTAAQTPQSSENKTLSTFSNVDRELRRAIIQTLKQTQPQLAKFLAGACWTWQVEKQCLNIILQNSQVQEQLKNTNSLLLRFFQKALSHSAISSITKLSFLNLHDNPPAGFPKLTRSNSPLQASAPALAASPVAKRVSPAGNFGSTPAAPMSAKGEPAGQWPAKSGQSASPSQSMESPPAPAQPQAVPPQPAELAQRPQSVPCKLPLEANPSAAASKEILNDYSHLPQEVQILQKVFLAQVKQRQHNLPESKPEGKL